MRIRSRLLILIFSMLIPALVGAGMAVYYVYNEQQKSYREGIQELANAMALLLDKEMSERARTLQALAQSPTITDNNLAGFYRFVNDVAASWDTTVVLSNQIGEQILNTRTAWGTRNLPRMTPSLQSQREKAGPTAAVVSDIYYAPIGKSHSFAVQVPVIRNDRVVYYIAMGSFTRQLQQLFEKQKLPAGWVATILDRQGVVAARSQNAEKFVGVVADATLREKMAKQASGTNDGTTLDGTPVTAFFSQAPESQWSFVISVPRADLIAPAKAATTVVGGIALLLLGMGVAVAFVVARATAKSMEELRLNAAALGEGKPIAALSSGVAEVDAVSREMSRASEQIRIAKAELEKRVAEAVAVAEQSQRAMLQSQKLEALGRLAGGIAHDFNNLMQTLTTGLQLMLIYASEPRLKQTAEACQRAVTRATELTRQMMAFGRVQEAHLATIDLAGRIEEIKPLLSGGVGSNIELRFDIPADLWPVTIDPVQFDLALLNVAINARDAMPHGGRLGIRMQNLVSASPGSGLPHGEYVCISVTDSGQGMAPEVLSRALEPFFTTKPVGQGSGMGLAQAYGFARQSGGTLSIESSPGHGTTINFRLPRSRAVPAPSPEVVPKVLPPMQKNRGRILFVEDDQLVSGVVIQALQQAGFEVFEAKNGEDALQKLKQSGPFDVVFSDIVMPGSIDGIALAQHIAKQENNTRVVLATGYSEQHLDIERVEILAKPYDIEHAIAVLSRD